MSLSFASRLQQSYSQKAEKKINKLVRILSGVSYDYVAVVAHLRNGDEALDGVRKFFKRRSQLLQKDAQTMLKIQQQIGGSTVLPDLQAPVKQEYETVQEILEDSLKKEKKISKVLLELHSELVGDVQPQIVQQVEEILQFRDEAIQRIEEQLIHLQQNVGQVGEHQISQFLLEDHSRSKVERLEQKQRERLQATNDSLSNLRRRQQLRPTLSAKRSLPRREISSEKVCIRKKTLLQ